MVNEWLRVTLHGIIAILLVCGIIYGAAHSPVFALCVAVAAGLCIGGLYFILALNTVLCEVSKTISKI